MTGRVLRNRKGQFAGSTGSSSGGGFWAALFGGARDRLDYERESYRLSGEEVVKSQQDGYHGDHVYQEWTGPKCPPFRQVTEAEAVDGWQVGDLQCGEHFTGYAPGCMTCRSIPPSQR